jgi:hypothetical protein
MEYFEDKLYDLQIGEYIDNAEMRWIRVPGGWMIVASVYQSVTSQFIPYIERSSDADTEKV